jgi:hypothetical protein
MLIILQEIEPGFGLAIDGILSRQYNTPCDIIFRKYNIDSIAKIMAKYSMRRSCAEKLQNAPRSGLQVEIALGGGLER